MSHSKPSRAVKCQICPWKGTRRYGPDGILCQPCPLCGRLVIYVEPWRSDPPVTRDIGQVLEPSKLRRVLSPERRAAFVASLAAARAKTVRPEAA
jgi:hypothetical protein